MIIVITVVMLLTLIPLAIFTQAVQQLPLARHDQDHESALAAAEAGRRRLPQPPEPEQQLLDVQRDEPAARRQPGVHDAGCRCPGPSDNGETFRYTPDTTKTPVDGHDLPHVVGQVAQRDPHGEGRDPAPGLPRLPLPDRLRDRRSRAVGRPDARACSTRGSANSRIADRLRARTRRTAASCTGPTRAVAERSGAHERRSVRVRLRRTFNGDTDTYYNSPTSQSVDRQSRSSAARAWSLNPLGCANTPVFDRLQRPGQRRRPAVPAREHLDPNAGRRRGRRAGLPLHRADHDRAAQLGQRRA